VSLSLEWLGHFSFVLPSEVRSQFRSHVVNHAIVISDTKWTC
jgi:hypothetical protein